MHYNLSNKSLLCGHVKIIIVSKTRYNIKKTEGMGGTVMRVLVYKQRA